MEKPITELAAKYLAIQSMADFLRETTVRDTNSLDHGKYVSKVFSEDDVSHVKRAFLKLCSEI